MTVHLLIEDVAGEKSRVVSFRHDDAGDRIVGAYRDYNEALSLKSYMERTSVDTRFSYRLVTVEVR